jgi:hypothetical protein
LNDEWRNSATTLILIDRFNIGWRSKFTSLVTVQVLAQMLTVFAAVAE